MDGREKEERLRKARDIVFRSLKFRPRSEQELRDKLGTKNFPVPVIEQTLQYFKDLHLIDDGLFARQWTSSRLKKPFGMDRIRLELKKMGIDGAIIRETLEEAARGYDESEIVTALARRRAVHYKNIIPEKMKRRLYGYLRRRGFSEAAVIRAIKDI